MRLRCTSILLFATLLSLLGSMPQSAWGQTVTLRGQVVNEFSGLPLSGAMLMLDGRIQASTTGAEGRFELDSLAPGRVKLGILTLAGTRVDTVLQLTPPSVEVSLRVAEETFKIPTVELRDSLQRSRTVRKLRGVEDFGIYTARKSEVVEVKTLTANLATNNPRQLFAAVAGLNIWESDGGGLQLGIGGRGLSPDRTSNFNTRQNGYDISADALGYPEAYYSPPAEALDQIEVVRGAAALQYGTQFGGLLNFKLRNGRRDTTFGVDLRQTAGSYGFFNSFNALEGTAARNKLNYYGYYQYKRSDGWRPNSNFQQHGAYGALRWKLNSRWELRAEYTFMDYLAQQPGGLTDFQFEEDPSKSIRARNWFSVDWNLAALHLRGQLTQRLKMNIRVFGLLAQRSSLGNLERINRLDLGGPRNLIRGYYQNLGQETRFIYSYSLGGQPATLLAGLRYYRGFTETRQGDGSPDSSADFTFQNPQQPEDSDFDFPSQNIALFAEHVFPIGPKFSLTPGARLEFIQTEAEGYFNQRIFDAAGNLVAENRSTDTTNRNRALLLLGIGLSWKPRPGVELYANITQNYRAINFSDIAVVNPNLRVDPDIADERGYSADLGFRGELFNQRLYIDATAFYMRYNQRIGLLLLADTVPPFANFRYRTNIADSRTWGLEVMAEGELWRTRNGKQSLSALVNLAVIHARYINTQDPTIRGKEVELVPPLNLRAKLRYHWRSLSLSLQLSHVQQHFTDATNAQSSPSAVVGVIPSYTILDFSASYAWRWFTFTLSVNNLTNTRYFTRRAVSYPGPGIIPADPIGVFGTLRFRFPN